ncbi:unnamed protein product [Paramecium sonneborni]|uniref:Uncharacterized protein n=1 Tax=Paramecium sonneborni TaxID=65129 RepID=A0A8S1RNN1_9CILI|nr:unnamed protein product [Paramecium sonneborni]
MIPKTLIKFQDDLLSKSEIPVIQINLPDMIKCQSKSYYEEQLKDILEDGSDQFEEIANIISELRQNIKKDFNYLSIHQQKQEQESQQNEEEAVQNNDGYALSDQEM